MECRCYRGDKNRTKLVKLEYKGRDVLWMILIVLIVASVIFLKILPENLPHFGAIHDILFYHL